MNYVDGFILAVPDSNRDSYRAMVDKAWPLFKEFGATRQVECWGDDVPAGATTDFHRAVKAEPGETVVFSWLEYTSKEVRDAASKKMQTDPRMNEMSKDMPFDGKRMIFGGFVPIFDERG